MTNQTLTKNTKGYVYAALAAILFGSSGLFVKLAYDMGLDSITLLTLQNLMAVPILWTISFIKYRGSILVGKKMLLRLFIMGFCLNSMVTLFYYKAFVYLDISIATILLFTYPILITLYALLFSKERPNGIIIFSLLTVFLGCIFVLDIFNLQSDISKIGILFGMGSALFYAAFNIVIEAIGEKLPSIVIASYSTSFALLFFLIYRFPAALLQRSIHPSQLGIAALLVCLCQIPPVILLYTSIQYIGAIRTSIVSNIEIPAAAVFGYWVYRETLNLTQLFGMLLVLGGILLMKNSKAVLSYLSIHRIRTKGER